jgi:hypothetical protein
MDYSIGECEQSQADVPPKRRFGLKQTKYQSTSCRFRLSLIRVAHTDNLVDSYDYEQKYKADSLFHEIGTHARIWKVYNDESDIIDKEMLENAEDSLDILLIFVRLPAFVPCNIWIDSMI